VDLPTPQKLYGAKIINASDFAITISIVRNYLKGGFQMSKYGKILKKFNTRKKNATLSQAVSPVNHSHTLEKEKAVKMTVSSGKKCIELSVSLTHDGLLLKMLRDYLLLSRVWYSRKCLLTWKVQVIMPNHILYLLVPSMHHTEETEYGLLPTPLARDWKGRSGRSNRSIVDDLPHKIEGNPTLGTQTGLKLQPNFVEYLMGYPSGWTDLNCQNQDIGWNG